MLRPRDASDAPAREPRRALTRIDPRSTGVQAAGLALLLVAPSLVWVALDRTVWPWDPAWYGQVSVDLWSTLRLHPSIWPTAMTHAFGAKPPGIAWLGQFFVPLGYKLDEVSLFLRLSTIACQAATLALVFATGRKLSNSSVGGLAAALLVSAAPLFVSMSHEYFAEPLQTLSVAWLLYILASARTWRPALTLTSACSAVALGLLAKLSTPFYMLFPAIGALAIVVAHRSPQRALPSLFRDKRVVLAAGAAVLFGAGDLSWYSVNWSSARAHADTINSTLYGTDVGLRDKLGWWLPHFDQAAFLPAVDWIAAGVVAAAIAVILFRRRRIPVAAVVVPAASACSTVLVIVLLALHPVDEIRYTLPLIVCSAVAIIGFVSLSGSRFLLVVLATAVAVEFVGTTSQSFGVTFARRAYPLVTKPRSSAFLDDLQDVVSRTCTPEANARISVVGGDFSFLNGNTLSFLADERFALEDRRCYYTPLGYAETDPNRAWRRVLSLKPPFYVSLDYARSPNALPTEARLLVSPNDPFNRVNRNIFRRVAASSHFSVVLGSRRDGLIVFRGDWGTS